MRGSIRTSSNKRTHVTKVLPQPLTGSVKQSEVTLRDVPTPEALAAWLLARGVDTAGWGSGDTKDVSKFWKEIKSHEAGAEMWLKPDDIVQPVRVVHVLRAKVTSPEFYEKGVFLLNTWQQFGDGRTRIRNGLLSEKLSLEEMPLEEHLHEVCTRAVREEEMQRVVGSEFKIEPGIAAPEFDPDYVCPIEVQTVRYVEHIIEVETSKSYPGLLTMYHLYTVEVVCSGLPDTDLNTLEFDHPNATGYRKLKYVHAWEWLQWVQIQRFLLDGSTATESKRKGSFVDSEALETWLDQFDLELEFWGMDINKSVHELWKELEDEETQLELWDRTDGIPVLVRVTHVLQLQIKNVNPKISDRLLFNTWVQKPNGKWRMINRYPSSKLSTERYPYGTQDFEQFTNDAVAEQLSHVVDPEFSLSIEKLPSIDDARLSGVQVRACKFKEKRSEVEESPSFKGLFTMYYLYCMEVECEGLPADDFTTLKFKYDEKTRCHDFKYSQLWRWQTLSEVQGINKNRRMKSRYSMGSGSASLSSADFSLYGDHLSKPPMGTVSETELNASSVPSLGSSESIEEGDEADYYDRQHSVESKTKRKGPPFAFSGILAGLSPNYGARNVPASRSHVCTIT